MWRDEWDKVAGIVAVTGAGGLLVGVFRSVIQRRYGGWWQWLALLAASVLVAVFAGLTVSDSGLSETQQWAVIGICAFLAEDLLLGFASLAAVFRKDPINTMRQVWDAVRGRSGT